MAGLLGERELDAMLVTSLPGLRWVTGFTGSNGACIVAPEERLFFTDFRYVAQSEREVRDFELMPAGRDLLGDVAQKLSGRVGFEDGSLPVRSHAKLTEVVAADVELVPATGLVEGLRQVKDDGELAAMRAAAELSDAAYERLAERGLDGRTERRIAFDLETTMRELGADDRSFGAIVAGGPHGALPHAEPRDLVVERNTLMVVDMGCMVDGYCSDCTRTFATGELDDEAREVYELVARAQLDALEAVRPGAACSDVDAVSRRPIAEAGFGEEYGHGLGHGVGLEVHEAPRLGQTAEGELLANSTVTVEPGVYLAGRFGVRIEDLVVVTESGADRLTRFTKELVTLD